MPLIRWNTLAWPWHFVDDTPSRHSLLEVQGHASRLVATPDAPEAFGTDAIWMAVRCSCPQAVAQALQLSHAAPANWASGLQAVHQPLPCSPGLVFVTPVIQGWVLVTGALPYPGGTSDSDLASSLLKSLSQQFPEVQYFGAHSGIAWHGYARYTEGNLERAFACVDSADHTIWNVGCDPAEGALQKAHARTGASAEATLEEAAWHQGRVFQMAERWSVNPQLLATMALPPSLGLVGHLDVASLRAATRSDNTTPRAQNFQRVNTVNTPV
jgi:hypothetical protein